MGNTEKQDLFQKFLKIINALNIHGVEYESIISEGRVIEGIKIKVATAQSMLELKSNTIRPEDKRDAMFLRQLINDREK